MLLRFYLLKYNDTIIVQSGVFVNTDRHKKSHRKGRFCGSFFGENHEVYLCKTFCAKHSTCRGEQCSPAFFTHESLALSYHRSSCRSLSPAVIQRHIVTTPTKPPTSVPAKNSSIKTPPADSVDILEECYADKREHRKIQYTIFTVRAITARKAIFAAVKYAKYLPLIWGWLRHICL